MMILTKYTIDIKPGQYVPNSVQSDKAALILHLLNKLFFNIQSCRNKYSKFKISHAHRIIVMVILN